DEDEDEDEDDRAGSPPSGYAWATGTDLVWHLAQETASVALCGRWVDEYYVDYKPDYIAGKYEGEDCADCLAALRAGPPGEPDRPPRWAGPDPLGTVRFALVKGNGRKHLAIAPDGRTFCGEPVGGYDTDVPGRICDRCREILVDCVRD